MDPLQLTVGFPALIVSCVCFGFMFAPLKRYETGDGVFVQWVQCSVVFLFGCVINVVRGLPPMNLTAAIGGFLYATGNIASVPVVAEMGIGLGMLVWGSVQIVVGWCVAHFGAFGTQPQTVRNPVLNYTGLGLTLLSGAMFLLAYGAGGGGGAAQDDQPSARVFPSSSENGGDPWASSGPGTPVDHHHRGSHTPAYVVPKRRAPILTKRKLFFISLAICLGTLHGMMMTPIVYIQDNDPHHSDNVLDYVFSHFTAVFFFSTLYFIVYSVLKRGRPFIWSELVLPSVGYGILWSTGMVLWILSNRLLSQPVAFPITVRLPAIIGALADVFLFRAVRGTKKLVYLFVAIAVGSAGVILVGLSL